ncbi:MAG: dihydroneopterin triphosphate diphosphatase [Gammaproteobacteria bacterium]|jgi:dihydroneopterin triphosphate diphosphatase|nr:dihydroneopterin triphosphate diphosphatase [Gammaproteobacteria bacterium]MBT7603475.1 dihydroneopterin triphosphate diphosphatase [Gammaproteobacteria bacterium]
MKKIPESILILIYTKNKDVLLLKKSGNNELWQSVTGSLMKNEKPCDAAARELYEETGIKSNELVDCKKEYVFEIYEMWKHKYEDGVTHNTEHVYKLLLNDKVDIKLDNAEHDSYEWVTRVKAAEKVFSYTNRQAIFELI